MKHVKDVQLTKTFTLIFIVIYGFQYIMETIVGIDRNGDCKSRKKNQTATVKKNEVLEK